MREVSLAALEPGLTGERAAFVACLATILELTPRDLPDSEDVDERAPGPLLARWLARLGMGFVPVRQPEVFNWPGPWLARARDAAGSTRPLVMYGFLSGVVFDPLGGDAWPDEPGQEHDGSRRALSSRPGTSRRRAQPGLPLPRAPARSSRSTSLAPLGAPLGRSPLRDCWQDKGSRAIATWSGPAPFRRAFREVR